ncbi:Hpt domain-containing protein [Paenibacillus pinistramenti]|uniref:Hpt domain-containing protein n=1 Tax=Paenibacillus pinistramenti TaxID=1768003 RepID=UPI0011087EB6|nr:Hpt domain-containing protein [Paenibacillus pinistramenti]
MESVRDSLRLKPEPAWEEKPPVEGSLAYLEDGPVSEQGAEDLAKARLLVVGDAAGQAASVLDALKRLGIREIDVVKDSRQAVNARFNYPYALILWDNRTAEGAQEAAWKIRALEKENGWFPVSLLLIIDRTSKEELDKYRSAGISDLIPAPFGLDELQAAVYGWLTEPHLQRGLLNIETVRALIEIDDGSREMIRSLLELLRKETPERITKLIRLHEDGQLQLAAEVAHSLKSGSLSIGMAYFAKVCGEIEQGCLAGLTASYSLLERLEQLFEESYAALEKSLAVL